MSQTQFGQTVALADNIVAFLTGYAANFCLPIKAERLFARVFALPDVPATATSQPVLVEIIPNEDIETRNGASTSFAATYSVNALILAKVGAGADAESRCSVLMQLRSQIIESLKKQFFFGAAAVHPFTRAFLTAARTPEKQGPYLLNRLIEEQVFDSETVLTFRVGL